MSETQVTKRVYCLYYVNGSECIGRTIDGHWAFVPVHLARTWADETEARVEADGLTRTAHAHVNEGPHAANFWFRIHGGFVDVRPIDITFELATQEPPV